MFDLIAGREQHLPSHATVPIVLSTTIQATAIALIAALPLLLVTEQLPEVPTMMAFVVAPPEPPPPPPLPIAKPQPQAPKRTAATPMQSQSAAPLEKPATLAALPDDEGSEFGVPGGVEGGIVGGVVGGGVGGLPEPPPPPPPLPPAPRAPVRIGGQIQQPQLIRRVEPEYPPLAVRARVQGVVILEATVGEDGDVRDVRLLRSANPLLDRAAEAALRQWRYSPVILNDTPVPFILTVTLSFFLEIPK